MRFQIGPLWVEIYRFFSGWQCVAFGLEIAPRMREISLLLFQYEIVIGWGH